MIDRTNKRLASGDDLIMWSEVAGGYSQVFPDLFEWNSENTGAAVVSAYQAPVVGNTVEAYNAMTIMQNGKKLSSYYKNRPVPLVEPNILPGPTRPNVTSVTFTPKSSSSTGRQPVSLKTSMAICFDFDFSYLFRDASTADVVLGASWYWASIGFMFWEHNIFRAIENGFTIIKCAQGGITGAVDPYGRALAAVPTSDNEVHLMEVPVQNGVFTLFRAWGWVFGWVCVFLSPVVLVVIVWDKIRQK
jgi:apolipoprotein N-acyltransferase